jgi:hypothetical protein
MPHRLFVAEAFLPRRRRIVRRPLENSRDGICRPSAKISRRRAIHYSANHMISGKLVDCVGGGGAWVGCVAAGALVETVEPSTVN